VSNKEQGSQSQ